MQFDPNDLKKTTNEAAESLQQSEQRREKTAASAEDHKAMPKALTETSEAGTLNEMELFDEISLSLAPKRKEIAKKKSSVELQEKRSLNSARSRKLRRPGRGSKASRTKQTEKTEQNTQTKQSSRSKQLSRSGQRPQTKQTSEKDRRLQTRNTAHLGQKEIGHPEESGKHTKKQFFGENSVISEILSQTESKIEKTVKSVKEKQLSWTKHQTDVAQGRQGSQSTKTSAAKQPQKSPEEGFGKPSTKLTEGTSQDLRENYISKGTSERQKQLTEMPVTESAKWTVNQPRTDSKKLRTGASSQGSSEHPSQPEAIDRSALIFSTEQTERDGEFLSHSATTGSKRTKPQSSASESKQTKPQSSAAGSKQTKTQPSAAGSKQIKTQPSASGSKRTKPQSSASESKQTKTQPSAAGSKQTKTQSSAASPEEAKPQSTAADFSGEIPSSSTSTGPEGTPEQPGSDGSGKKAGGGGPFDDRLKTAQKSVSAALRKASEAASGFCAWIMRGLQNIWQRCSKWWKVFFASLVKKLGYTLAATAVIAVVAVLFCGILFLSMSGSSKNKTAESGTGTDAMIPEEGAEADYDGIAPANEAGGTGWSQALPAQTEGTEGGQALANAFKGLFSSTREAVDVLKQQAEGAIRKEYLEILESGKGSEFKPESDTQEKLWEEVREERREELKKEPLLILVNKWHYLPEDYNADAVDLPNGQQISSTCYEPLMQMLDDCALAGGTPIVCSGYRPHEKQVNLFDEQINRWLYMGYGQEEAEAMAATAVAVPGTSEHELGLAADIYSSENMDLDESQIYTFTQQWLMEHCWEYGFVLRYPKDKSEITGIIFEPWHYRYVGKKYAEIIHKAGICLEEYLDEADHQYSPLNPFDVPEEGTTEEQATEAY